MGTIPPVFGRVPQLGRAREGLKLGAGWGFAGGLFGGYFQWVLDAACEAVEWPYQPLRPVALRMALDQGFWKFGRFGSVMAASQAVSGFLEYR